MNVCENGTLAKTNADVSISVIVGKRLQNRK